MWWATIGDLMFATSHGQPVQQSTPIVDESPRCWRCNRKLAEFVARPWRFTCPKCNAVNGSPPV